MEMDAVSCDCPGIGKRKNVSVADSQVGQTMSYELIGRLNYCTLRGACLSICAGLITCAVVLPMDRSCAQSSFPGSPQASQRVIQTGLLDELDFGSRQENDDAPLVDLNRNPVRPDPVTGQPTRSNQPPNPLPLSQPDIQPMTISGNAQLPQVSGPVSEQIARNRYLTGELYASFDFMFPERSGPAPQAFVFTNGVQTLNTTAFSYSEQFAPAATIAIGDQFGYAFEFNFFNSANHRFNGVQSGTNVVPVFFGGIPATPANSYTIDAEAELNNYELNQWVRHSERLRLGLGLRIINLNEVFNITETGTTTGFFSNTSNDLYGGQFAAQYLFFSNDIAAIYFQGKAGLYYNHVKLNANALNVQMAPDSDELSFAGDLRLVADFPLTDHFSIRAGYHATFLTRIAQALDQNDDLSLATPSNPGNFDFSTPTYRGGFFGFVANY